MQWSGKLCNEMELNGTAAPGRERSGVAWIGVECTGM
mgnify:CR=1 FL=1